ncbi:MAG: D-glycerate dehydrogenase [bacterium]
MQKIFVTRGFAGKGLELLSKQKNFKVEVYKKQQHITRAELLKHIKGCTGVITMLTEKVNQEFLDAAGPSLKVVANYAVSYDNIDVKLCTERGIKASNTPLVLDAAVAEHTVALIYAISKRLVEADRFARSGKYIGWEPELLMGTELFGKTLGIIGLGRIGVGVAERCSCMGMSILYHDLKPNAEFEKRFNAKFADNKTILKNSDYISLHVPLLPSTRHLIGEKELKLMKKTAYLINTARGPVIDEVALAKALKTGEIRGAALDVFEFEPKITPALLKLDNVIVTPHTASATLEARSAMGELAARNVIAALNGKPMPSQIKP